ncbi:hypothetical protein A5707_20295 [Mycobacterium kyorinense]|uniref:Mce protein n=1 Tax=Mycobacterium kyorinense TaxID=487514 RepID=A0A1A2ZCM1_9MYCO|nr:hypothetical protein [Mycobacterium kyorinense]OBI47217.1 hypothetical protein A5707_20295 [Mycobacterium kyorinense]
MADERPKADKADADALALAEQAEAEAAEAEALAAAARARARAIRLRREAEEAAEGGDDAVSTATEITTTAASAESTEPAVPSDPVLRRRRIPGIATALTAAAIVAICALLGASGFMIWHHHGVVAQQQRSAAFVAGAKQGIVNMLSLDYKNAKDDVQRVINSSTGEFLDDFQKRAADFTSVVEKSKVVTEGAVVATAVESADKDSGVVLMLATERVTNSAGAKEEPRTFRLRVSVARDGDQIKLSKVEFVL